MAQPDWGWRIFPTKSWRGIPSFEFGNIRRLRRVEPEGSDKEVIMLGKLAGAWLGERIAGERQGAKGAILGYGAAALARRSVPTLAALVLGGWAFRKWRAKRRANAAYPSDATPSSPAESSGGFSK
jgi:hypothetical protein